MRCGLLLALLAAGAARAQSIPASGRTVSSFIPRGYRLLYQGRNSAVGDLNGDGRPDVVLALTSILEDTTLHPSDHLPPRLLLVLWRTAAGYKQAVVARQLLLHRNSSYMGEPYDYISIAHGVLSVHYDIGGNIGRTTTAKFRYQDAGFYLIGETDAYGSHRSDCDKLPCPPGYNYRDTNYITGRYRVIRTSDECKLLADAYGRQPVRPLRKLTEYTPKP